MSDGPADPVPDSWRHGTRAVGSSSRNRTKVSNHVWTMLKIAEHIRALSRDGDEVERHLDEIRSLLRDLRRHERRAMVRVKVELGLAVREIEWRRQPE